MNKTENNMITQFRAANRLLATVLPAPEAFKVALSLFIVHFLFNSANSRIRAALGKRSHKTDFPTDAMFEQADRLLSAIHPEGSAAIGLGDYTKKLTEAVQRELIDIISGVDVVNRESSILDGLLDIVELRDILPGRHVDYKPECLSNLLESLFVSNEMYRDRFQSVNPFVIHNDYQSDTEDFSARGLSETEDGALWNFYNYAIDPSFVIRHDLVYHDGAYHWEEGGNDTIIFNPIKHMRDLSEPERYTFFEKEMNTELSVLSPTGGMAIVLPIEYLSKEGPIQQTLNGLVRSDAVTAVIEMPEKLFEPEYVGATCLLFLNKRKKSSYNGKIAFVKPNYEALHDISTVEIQSIAEYCNRLISNWIESAVVSASDNMNLLPWSHISALSAELNDPSIKWAPLSSLCKIQSGKQGTSLKAESLSPHIWDMYFSERPQTESGMLRGYHWDVSGLGGYEIETKSLLVAVHSVVEPEQIANVDIRAQIFDPEKSREKGINVGKGIWGFIPRDETIDIEYLYFQLYSPIVKKQIEAIINQPERKYSRLTKAELGSLIISMLPVEEQHAFVADQSLEAIKLKEQKDRDERESLAKTMSVDMQTIRQETEQQIGKMMTHNIMPKIPQIEGPIERTLDYINEQSTCALNLCNEGLKEKHAEVRSDLQKAAEKIRQIRSVIEKTERYINKEFCKDDFRSTDICKTFDRIKKSSELSMTVSCSTSSKVILDEGAFEEAINNLIENAKKHACTSDRENVHLDFAITEDDEHIIINYFNNGVPFPRSINENKFLKIGEKGGSKGGCGYGGAWLGKVLDAHGGIFQIVRDSHPLHFRISFKKER